MTLNCNGYPVLTCSLYFSFISKCLTFCYLVLILLMYEKFNMLTYTFFRWLPLDVARIWGRHWLELWLEPNSELALPTFPLSKFLSLPLMSILNIARYFLDHFLLFFYHLLLKKCKRLLMRLVHVC